MNTLAQARQRGRRSRKTGCEALIQAYGERHPQSAKRSTIHTPNYNSLLIEPTADSMGSTDVLINTKNNTGIPPTFGRWISGVFYSIG